jgi:GntR family transcriptional regulator
VINLEIFISNTSEQPIYEQISSQIKALIVSERLQEGDPLPSIRNLARDLRISVITTKRAYDELEREGYINTVAAKGCFVAKQNSELIKENYLKQIEEHMQNISELAKYCGLTNDDLIEMFRFLNHENND